MRLLIQRFYTASLFVLFTFLANINHNPLIANDLFSLSVTVDVGNIPCHGDANGIITANPDGGAPPYNYAWSNGASTQSIDNLEPGTYTVTVTDQLGATATASGTVEEPPAISLQMNANYETCDGSADAHAGVQTSGGTGAFTFLWSDGQTSFIAENLSAGDYFVTVTDENGCTAVGYITVELSPEGIWVMTSSIPPSCNGGDDGTAHISVMTGTAPFTIVWSDGQTGTDPTGLSAGTYSVTVTDANGCTAEDEAIVTEPSEVDGIFNIDDNTDCNQPNGRIELSAFGGTPGYTYSWNTGATTNTLTDLPGGNYMVTLTDANGCTAVLIASLNDDCPPACPADAGSLTPNASPVCLDGQEVEISATPDGNSIIPQGFEVVYLLSLGNGQLIQQISQNPVFIVSSIGSYTIHAFVYNSSTFDINSITLGTTTAFDIHASLMQGGGQICASLDMNGAQISVIDNCSGGNCKDPVIRNITIIETACGVNNGSATIDIAGNPADFAIVWSPNVSTGFSASGLAAGTYSVTITDANDPTCQVSETFAVGTVGGPEATLVQTTPATCNESNGTATLSPFGFVYEWCNGGSGNNVTNLPAGTCTVTVTDPATGCFNVIEVEIGTFNPLEASATITGHPDCGVANGSVSIDVMGGSFNYTYNWNDGGSGAVRNNLAAGIYEVTVTDNGATGCVDIVSFVLTDDVAGAAVSVDPVGYTNCPGESDATINFNIVLDPGFASPEVVLITDAGGNIYTNGNLGVGSYCIVVTDANGCVAGGACFEIQDAERLDVDVELLDEECVLKGSIMLKVTGGNGPYTFDWADLAGNNDPQNRSDLNSGSYDVTITDNKGCSVVVNDLIVEDACSCSLPVIESVVVIEASCGNSDGQAVIHLAGNPADFAIVWSPNVSTGFSASGLAAGTYSVTITDANDPTCQVSETFAVGTVGGPEATLVQTTPATCNESNGTATLSPFGFVYEWCNGGSGNNVTNLPAGTCTVTVTDPATGCFNVIEVEIGTFNPLEASATITGHPDCGVANGSVSIDVVGGSFNYTYNWNDGGSGAVRNNLAAGIYEVTVTDNGATGCVDIVSFVLTDDVAGAAVSVDPVGYTNCPGESDATINFNIVLDPGFASPEVVLITDAGGNIYTNGNLGVGSYCIVVTDANGCVAGGACFEIQDAERLDVDVELLDEECVLKGSIMLKVTGGNGPYTFDWADLAGNNDPQNRSDLNSGSYDVTIIDNKGCSVVVNDLIVEDACSCSLPVIESVVVIEASCGNSDGQVSIQLGGNPADYLYTWAPPVSPTNQAFNVAAGIYSVTITDINDANCFIVEDFTVGSAGGPAASASTTPASCTAANGSISLSPANFTYNWSDGFSGAVRNGLASGRYFIEVIDPSNPDCANFLTVDLSSSNDLQASVNVDAQPSCGNSDGSVSLSASGGSGDYTFEWNDGFTGSIRSDLTAGAYEVKVIDNIESCQTTLTFVLADNVPSATVTILVDPVMTTCPTSNDGTVEYDLIFSQGFAQPANVQIVDSDGNVYINGSLSAGNYCIVVRDANNCVAGGACFRVLAPNQINLDLAPLDATCTETASILVTDIQGGSGNYNFDWQDLVSMNDPSDRTGLDGGSYTCVVSDGAGCIVNATASVEGSSMVEASFEYNYSNCTEGQIMVSFNDLSVAMNNIGISHSWVFSNGATSNNPNPVVTTNSNQTLDAQLIVTAADGCIDTAEASLTISLIIVELKDTIVSCNGEPVALNPSGNATYNYNWYPADDLSDPEAANPIASPASTTTYTVQITSLAGADTCQIIKEVLVIVPDDFNLEVPDDFVACDREATLQASSSGNVTFSWYNSADEIIGSTADVVVPVTDDTYYYVIAEDAYGCSKVDTVAITEGAVDFEIQGSLLACENMPAQITAVNLDDEDVLTYQWTPDSAIVSGASTSSPIINTSQDGSVTLFVAVSNQYDCIANDSITIDIIDTSLDASIISQNQCEEGVVNFSVDGVNLNHYIWNFGDMSTQNDTASGSNVSYTYPDTGTYTVTLTLPAGANCITDTVSMEVYVAPAPIVEVDFDHSFLSCSDTALINFTDLTVLTTSDTIASWQWTFSNGQSSDVESPSITVYNSETLIVELLVTTVGRCEQSITDTIEIDLIEVEMNPEVNACPQQEVFLNPDPDMSYTYSWSPAALVSDPDAANPSTTATENTVFTVVISNVAGCSTEKTVNLIVQSNLEGFTITSNDTTTCDDQAFTLTAAGPPNVTFVWYHQNDSIANTSQIDVMPGNVGDTDVYYVIGSDQFGCMASDSIAVTNRMVDFNLIGPNSNLCKGDTIEIVSEIAQSPGDILTYQWSPSQVIVDLSDEASPIISATESFTFFGSVSNQYGCMTTDSIMIEVTDLADQLSISAEPDTTCERGASIQLNVTSHPNYTYAWEPGSSLDRTDVSNPVAMPEVTTEYTVLVRDEESGCEASERITITVIDPACEEPFVFFPNAFTPNGDNKNDVLRVRGISLDEVYFVVYNRWGEKVFESFSKDQGWDGTFKGKQLSSDVYGYYLRVKCYNGNTFTKKGNVSLLR